LCRQIAGELAGPHGCTNHLHEFEHLVCSVQLRARACARAHTDVDRMFHPLLARAHWLCRTLAAVASAEHERAWPVGALCASSLH
jgi:hypothetical protein